LYICLAIGQQDIKPVDIRLFVVVWYILYAYYIELYAYVVKLYAMANPLSIGV